MSDVAETPHRERCLTCFKPRQLCVCARIPRVDNRTELFVLQHPRERFHPLGTVRFVELGFARASVTLARNATLTGLTREVAVPPGTGVLYPAPGARPLESLQPRERPSGLVVIDGTWANAKSVYRHNPWLHDLPCYSLTPAQPSNYRIRREPSDLHVSTLEAVVWALRALEPDLRGLDELLQAFDSMIDDQIRYIETSSERAKRMKTRTRPRRIHRQLVAAFSRMVVAYGEAFGDPKRPRRRRTMLWSAIRPSTGETFDRLVLPEVYPSDQHLMHMGIERSELEAGVSPERLRSDWDAFSPPGDVVVAWNQSTLDLMMRFSAQPREHLLLKAAYASARTGAPGALEHVAAREQLDLETVAASGRAGPRLGMALAVLELIREEAIAAIARQEAEACDVG